MNIYVSHLSFKAKDQDLQELFEAYGTVTSARVIKDRETGRSRGFGFVEMEDDEQAKKAIAALDQATFDGFVINVTESRPREDRPAGGGRPQNRGNGNFNKRY